MCYFIAVLLDGLIFRRFPTKNGSDFRQNCALPETLIPLEDVTVDNGAHTINVDETLKAAATCALPLLKRYLSPVLAKCVRSQLGRGYAWSVPMTSIESLTQEVEWYKDYKPLIEEGFLSSLFEEEAKIREGYNIIYNILLIGEPAKVEI